MRSEHTVSTPISQSLFLQMVKQRWAWGTSPTLMGTSPAQCICRITEMMARSHSMRQPSLRCHKPIHNWYKGVVQSDCHWNAANTPSKLRCRWCDNCQKRETSKRCAPRGEGDTHASEVDCTPSSTRMQTSAPRINCHYNRVSHVAITVNLAHGAGTVPPSHCIRGKRQHQGV